MMGEPPHELPSMRELADEDGLREPDAFEILDVDRLFHFALAALLDRIEDHSAEW